MADFDPDSEEALAECLRSADTPFRIRGGGTYGLSGGEGTGLITSGLTGITLYEPGALTLVARAGTSLAEIDAALAAEDQRLPFEPMDYRPLLGTTGTPTIGGVIATNTSGPRRISVGAARDFLLGVRYVDGLGRVVRNGGRVMKNVTGYDLVKLMAGSYGTLGVLTEVALKVLPRVEKSATVVLKDLDVRRAVEAMAAALGSPFEVTGAAHDPARAETLIRVEGFSQSVGYRAGRLVDLFAPFGGAEVVEERDWSDIRDATAIAGEGAIWRLSVRPSDAPAVLDRIEPEAALLDWGGGLIWLRSDGDPRARMQVPGHATLVRPSEATAHLPRLHPQPVEVETISSGLRARFDPRGLLNPGLSG